MTKIMPRLLFTLSVALLLSFTPGPAGARQGRLLSDQQQDWPAPLRDAIAGAERSAADGDFKTAAHILADHLRKNPDDACAYLYYDLGYFLYRAGDSAAAVPPLQTVVQQKPGFTEAWQLLGAVQAENGRHTDAAGALEHALALSNAVETRYQCAVCWLKAGQPGKALPLLQRLEQTPAPRPEWLVALAETHQALQNKEQTARTLEKAARLQEDPDLLYRAAWLWLDANRPDQALPLLKMLGRKPRPQLAWLLALSHVYMNLDQPLAAAGTMDAVIRRDARPEYLYNGGLLWLQADRPDKALPHLKRLSNLPKPEPDWLIALGQAWLCQGDVPQAAETTERAARISGRPGHAYRAGVLRLQLEQGDAALAWLLPLQRHPQPRAEWLIALAQARVLKQDYPAAASVMEQAADISGRPEHVFQAAQLWLQADRPRRALPLLKRLAATPDPRGSWLVALSGTWQRLDNLTAAAETMERAAGLTGEGDHFHQAAMLWRRQQQSARALGLLQTCAGLKPVKQHWLVDLADLLVERGDTREALRVMARTQLVDTAVASPVRFRGATLWLQLQRPRKALPVLSELCRAARPAYAWLAARIKTCVELKNLPQAERTLERLLDLYPEQPAAWQLAVWCALQQTDYAGAAAAMEVLQRLTPDDTDLNGDLSRYYAMAGIPVRAAAAMQKTLPPRPEAADWDRLTNIYLSGQCYALALAPAQAAVAAGPNAGRWEMLGDIYYHLQRFRESQDAYRHAAELSAKADLLLKRGYALLKLDDLTQAATCFRASIAHAENNGSLIRAAHESLAYIDKMHRQAGAD